MNKRDRRYLGIDGGSGTLLVLMGILFIFLASCSSVEVVPVEGGAVPPAPGISGGKNVPDAGGDVPSKIEIPEGPLDITVMDAILFALDRNREFLIDRIAPSIRKAQEDIEKSAFDTTLHADVSGSRRRTEKNYDSDSDGNSVSSSTDAGIGVSKSFATGTDVSIDFSTSRGWSNLYSDEHSSHAGISITQSLLRDAGTAVNLARLRQARIDTQVSYYELRGYAEALVADIEQTYWDYALAKRQMEIYTNSLKLAEDQLKETKERINVGKLAGVELSAAEADVALRKSALIDARSQLEKTRLRLIRLINPPREDIWSSEVKLKNEPKVPDVKLDEVEAHVKVAIKMRNEMNESRLLIKSRELEITRTKNGMLPRLDLFLTLGKTGYADSFRRSADKFSGKSYDVSGGITFEFPLSNRGARARHRNAMFSLEQAEESVRNLAQLIEVDVRSAYIEVNRAKEQVTATAATRKLQQETLRAEQEKFKVGKSTTLLVAQAQRDLVAAEINEVKAVVDYLKAIVDLYRLEGSLLSRRGISLPGGPVEIKEEAAPK
ncbi:MAG: TolC family protein [Planctomycetota bacterium]|jgi:outer membrane protein TolC